MSGAPSTPDISSDMGKFLSRLRKNVLRSPLNGACSSVTLGAPVNQLNIVEARSLEVRETNIIALC